MDICIIEGTCQHIDACADILLHSELGRRYFERDGSARVAVLESLEQNNLFVALDGETCVGFMYYIPKGAFHSFPYLHLLAVEEAHRGKGIGTKMLGCLEELVCKDKIFLVVADFNPGAKRFYEKAGYRLVGEIPNLYREGITEYLMMKEIRRF